MCLRNILDLLTPVGIEPVKGSLLWKPNWGKTTNLQHHPTNESLSCMLAQKPDRHFFSPPTRRNASRVRGNPPWEYLQVGDLILVVSPSDPDQLPSERPELLFLVEGLHGNPLNHTTGLQAKRSFEPNREGAKLTSAPNQCVRPLGTPPPQRKHGGFPLNHTQQGGNTPKRRARIRACMDTQDILCCWVGSFDLNFWIPLIRPFLPQQVKHFLGDQHPRYNPCPAVWRCLRINIFSHTSRY